MKLLALSALLAISGQASAFAPSSPSAFRSTSLMMANVLEGKEIEKAFTPINNMLLVKKVDVVEQTGGGLFLTGKVSFDVTSQCSGEIVLFAPVPYHHLYSYLLTCFVG